VTQLKRALNPILGRALHTRIEIADANKCSDCLALRGLESVFGYNFTGKTDILLAHSMAVRAGQPDVSCVAAFELKKGEVNCSLLCNI